MPISRLKLVIPLFVAGAMLFTGGKAFTAPPAGAPIVIGQTLPLAGLEHHKAALRIMAGVNAHIQHINATGGIKGRPLRIITLDDENDPAKHVQNLRRLIQQEKAVAIINCVGDRLCRLTAETAAAFQVPLIGPLSGAHLPRGAAERYVFRVRPEYAREAEIMARQMATMGVGNVALIAQSGHESAQVPALKDAFKKVGLVLTVIDLKSGDRIAVDKLLRVMETEKFGAAILDVSPDILLNLNQGDFGRRTEWPGLITSLSGPYVPLLASAFRGRTVAYTMVVPNPEASTIPLVREFVAHAERHDVGPEAISHAGFEAYINVRICVEALRRAKDPLSPRGVASALESLSTYDLGGFSLNLKGDQPSASNWADVGVVSKVGFFLD